MKIQDFDQNGSGTISFLIQRESHQEILDHLKLRKIHAWGGQPETDFSEIFADTTIEKLNEALEDFEG
jgi:hypothetical protein